MLKTIADRLYSFNKKEGEIASFLVYPLLFVVIYEVLMRYVFNTPTTWGFELTTFLYGLHFMFGNAYTDVQNGHVKVDIFTTMMPQKIQSILAIFTNVLFFLPVMTCLTIWSFRFAYTSTIGGELNPTSWAPPIWPIKILMAVCFLFLLLQGVANLFNEIHRLKRQSERGDI